MSQLLTQIRKFLVSTLGGILLVLGILMVILPGPAIIIIPLALVILNTQHPDKVRYYVRKFQRGLSQGAHWLDEKLNRWS